MYVLLLTEYNEYYTGKRYISQGETFPCFTRDINEAKKYKTDRIARNAAEKLAQNGAYFYSEVRPVR